MPWTNQVAIVMGMMEQAKLITPAEYDEIRALLLGESNQMAPVNQVQDVAKIPAAPKGSEFVFGKASKKELEGVKTELQLLAHRALELSTQDFCVYDGLRTVKEQEALVAKGASKTMNSKHLKGLAIDLVPWKNGKPVWEWELIYPIACAVDAAAREMGIEHKIRWGGAWDRTLADFHGDPSEYKRVVEEYVARRKAMGQSAFIDGPHFEWID